MSKTIRFNKKGRLIVVTDIHGNKDDFDTYIDEIWDRNNPDCHILFTGDLIHEIEYSKDLSVEILDEVFYLLSFSNFHVLLGNHEFCQIVDEDVYKWGINQTQDFKEHVRDKCEWEDEYFTKLTGYEELMKSFSYFAVTENGFFISHAGPSYHNYDMSPFDICPINSKLKRTDRAQYDYHMKFLEEMIWARPYDDYMEDKIDDFLSQVGCKFMVVGHTPCEGQVFHLLGNQIRYDSSFLAEKKYYLDIPLDEDIKSIYDVPKYLKMLGE